MTPYSYEQILCELAQGNLTSVEQRLWQTVPALSACEIDPLTLKAAWHLLRLLLDASRLTEALMVLAPLVRIEGLSDETRARCWATRANVYAALGDSAQALADIGEALALLPKDERMLATRASWRSVQSTGPEQARSEMWVWASTLQQSIAPGTTVRSDSERLEPLDATPWRDEGRIRVGYVSGDFRNHVARHFIEPILRHHDHTRYEIHAFMTFPADALTPSFMSLVDGWHDASNWSDEALFKTIQAQGIDVLVDLSGHSEGARLGVFARRAAPVQVTWFGYMGMLGLPEMDWRFSDAVVTPQGSEHWHSERIWRLRSVYAYQPPVTQSAREMSLPARRNGYVTMVCLNHSRKISDASLALWGRLLRANPDCGLILISADKSAEYALTSLDVRLRKAGVPVGQVTVVPRLNTTVFMSLSQVADFAVDTFPVSGGATTLLAMSMGLPVLALDREGAGPLETLSARLLKQADLSACVVATEAAYLEQAQAWLNDRPLLEALRAKLPQCVAQAPFMQHRQITREIEAAYESMLQRAHEAARSNAREAMNGENTQ